MHLRPIIVKEFRQIARDRRTLGVLIFIPAFMLVMFGYALNFDVKHVPLAVVDEDRTATSRDFVEHFLHSEYFDLEYRLGQAREIDPLMRAEKIRVALVVPRGFAERISSGLEAPVQVLVEGSNASAAATAVGYVNAFVQQYAARLDLRAAGGAAALPVDYRPRVWYNPELESTKMLVPGLIGFILAVIAVVSTALSIVREKERNTMEQILVSPVRPLELVVGKTVPYVLIAIVASAVILAVGQLLFGVEVRGSYGLLFGVTLVYLMACLGLGLLISSVAETQQVAFMVAVMVTVLPSFVLSGFVFPIENMPAPIRAVTYAIPARYYLSALRAIMLKGVGAAVVWPDVLGMTLFALFTLGLSTARLRRKKL